MDAWRGRLAAVFNLDDSSVSPFNFLRTDGRLVLTGPGAAAQTGHNSFVVRDEDSSGYIFIATSGVSANLYVTPGPHLSVQYSAACKKLMRETTVMEVVEVHSRPIFVGNEYVQHAGSVWRGEHFIRYHSYPIPKSHDLRDGIGLAYEGSIALREEKHLRSVEYGLDYQLGVSSEQPRLIHGFPMSSECEIGYSKQSMFMLEAENFPEDA